MRSSISTAVEPEEVVVIEDTEAGVAAAKGGRCVAVAGHARARAAARGRRARQPRRRRASQPPAGLSRLSRLTAAACWSRGRGHDVQTDWQRLDPRGGNVRDQLEAGADDLQPRDGAEERVVRLLALERFSPRAAVCRQLEQLGPHEHEHALAGRGRAPRRRRAASRRGRPRRARVQHGRLEPVHRPDELGHERRRRRAVDLLGPADLLDPPLREHAIRSRSRAPPPGRA